MDEVNRSDLIIWKIDESLSKYNLDEMAIYFYLPDKGYVKDISIRSTICSAIYHHDDKESIDAPMDEVLKDADVMHHVMNDLSKPIKEKEQARYDNLCKEFGL